MEKLNQRYLSPEDVLNVVCDYFKIDKQLLLSRSRKSELIYPKMIICCFLKELGYPFERIGKTINRDHSTAVYYCKKADDLLSSNLNIPEVKRTLHDYAAISKLLARYQYNFRLGESIIVENFDLLQLSINYTKSFVN